VKRLPWGQGRRRNPGLKPTQLEPVGRRDGCVGRGRALLINLVEAAQSPNGGAAGAGI